MVIERAKMLPALLVLLTLLGTASRATALELTKDGTINVSVRSYVNARIGTMAKQCTQLDRPNNFGGTFPCSGAGHLIQNRYFLEVEWDHDLLPWAEDYVPKWLSSLEYTLSYRGEYEGIYDFGPKEYSHSTESRNELEAFLRQNPLGFNDSQLELIPSMLYFNRHRLRQVASYRNRLFLAFVDFELGDLFVRVGRQNLVWGETDIFRLLDNINPIDNSFGGFFIDLDERRVPLNMLRGSYFLGTLGPLDQVFLEGYAAYDRSVAFVPGAPAGSPWAIPLGPPTGRTLQILTANPHNMRGGGRLVFNWQDFTLSLASYFTILDLQAVRFRRAFGGSPKIPADPNYQPGVSSLTAEQYGPRVWVNGASMSTAVPELKGILRSEVAWFRDEALFRGPTPDGFPLDGSPFGTTAVDPNYRDNFAVKVLTGQLDTVSRKDTVNFAIGWDMNQYVRFLNPAQTFLFSTQFFYRHIFDYDACSFGVTCQALPVPQPNNSTRVVPLPQNQYLQTLLINTTYNHNIPGTDFTVQTTPGLAMFYDWQGALLFQPSLRFVRDPWRFIVDYTTINSGVFRYQIGLARDRSNVRFQIEYVL